MNAVIAMAATAVVAIGCGNPSGTTARTGTRIDKAYFAFATVLAGKHGWRVVCIEASAGQTVVVPRAPDVETSGTCGLEVRMPLREQSGALLSLDDAQRIAADEANAAAYSVLDRSPGYDDAVCRQIIAEMNRSLAQRVPGSSVSACGSTPLSPQAPVVAWPGPVPPQPREQPLTCETAMPEVHECWELPDLYVYKSPAHALHAVKVRENDHSLKLHNNLLMRTGYCPGHGYHYNVRIGNGRAASIICCDCCSDDQDGPSKGERCQIIW